MRLRLVDWILESPSFVPLPVCAQIGARLIGCSVRNLVSDAAAQSEAVSALKETFHLPMLMSAMDLSVEAEAMGAEVVYTEDEIPTISGRRITDLTQAAGFRPPVVGEGRTSIGLEVVRSLKNLHNGTPVLGCMIGPFSLLIRLVGATEAFEWTVSQPAFIHGLLEKIVSFQVEYAKAYRSAGADGVMIAEPAAGLLSPRAMRQFSSDYIRPLIAEVQHEDFTVILHNCGAKTAHLKPMMESGARILHFGAPMDLPQALAQTAPDCLIGGNLDPYSVFVSATPDEMRLQTEQLLQACGASPRWIPSSGCDLPAHTPVENLRAFLKALSGVPKASRDG